MHEPGDVGALRALSVPTLANAIEAFDVRPPTAGYNSAPLTCHYPELGMLVGYAVTVEACTTKPSTGVDLEPYWRFVQDLKGPKVVVVRDADDPPGGAMWGEWNANVHRALGCVGTVTQGAVRDLDQVGSVGFQLIATTVSVAHGYGAFTAYGEPVEVAGLPVRTGELLVGDRHGVLSIPDEIPLRALIDAARTIDALESEVFAFCQSDGFSVDGLAKLAQSVHGRWPGRRSGA